MKRNRPLLFILMWSLVGLIYFPIFVAAWCLHIVARLLLSISYCGMLNVPMGKEIFKSIFRWSPIL
jgi:hypothetical protein